MPVSISIVLYHNGDEIQKAIQSIFQSTVEVELYLIDNSKTARLRKLADHPNITYIFNNSNLGYGAAHNVAIRQAIKSGTKYHIVMNPDVTFDKYALEKLVAYMDAHPDVGSLMPKVFDQSGNLQKLCKLLPTPFDLIGRRFIPETALAKKWNAHYELHHFGYERAINTPCLSGCFMFSRTAALEKSGLFDTRFFLYLEDYDLNRRINRFYKTLFYPEVSIVHGHEKGSYNSFKLLLIHSLSAIKYFNKWGWFKDKERKTINEMILESIAEKK
jgi:GT2 family glycosyltransferase